MKCLQCHIEFVPKRKTAKFCSDACRRDYNRAQKYWKQDIVETDGPLVPLAEKDEDDCTSPFQIDKDYWTDRRRRGFATVFDKTREAKCAVCGTKFKTQLASMRFCTFKCLEEFHRKITGGL